MTKMRHGGISYTNLDLRYYIQAQLSSTTAPSGASLIGVADADGYFANTDVEAVLQELVGTILPGEYLRLDGTNTPTANYDWTTDLTTTGTGTFGDLTVDTDTLYVDKADHRVGIGTTSPDAKLQVVGDAFIGDDGTNYTEIKSDGEINLHGTARVYDGHELQAKDFKAPGAGAATLVNRGLGTAWRFDDGSEESIHVEMRIPAKWVDTEDITVILIWDSPATGADCDWEIRYLFRAIDEDMTVTTPDGTLQDYKTSSATANGMVHSALTIPAADFGSGDKKLIIQVFRDGNDGSDTLGQSAFLHAVLVRGTADRMGGSI